MQNFVQEGKVITLTAPYAVSSGAGAKVGFIFGVATADVANATSGEFAIEGVFDLVKDTSTFSVGEKVYWDNTNKVVTETAAGNMFIGVATTAAATDAATVNVALIGPCASPRIFVSDEQTGTGSAQNVAHGLGVVPAFVLITPTDLSPATVGSYVAAEGTHTSTNVVVTVTAGKKFKVLAIA